MIRSGLPTVLPGFLSRSLSRLLKSGVLLYLCFTILELPAEPALPLSIDLGVYPEGNGNVTDARLDWRWTDHLSSTAGFSFASTSDSGELPGYGAGALYTVISGDGSMVVSPVVWSDRLGILRYSLAAGLGLKTESYRERGTYQSVGTQVFDNEVSSWRVGTPLRAGLTTRLGPVEFGWDLVVWPLSLYSLDQTQSSSLIAPTGTLRTFSFIGPELDQDFRIQAFSLFWIGVSHEFLWLSVPRLVQNDEGDAWTTVIEGRTNQAFRFVGGLRLPVPMGALDLGLGWRRTTSVVDDGDATELDEGLAFELRLVAGR